VIVGKAANHRLGYELGIARPQKYGPMTKTLVSRPAVEPQNRLPNLKRNSATVEPHDSPHGKCWCSWLVAVDCLVFSVKGQNFGNQKAPPWPDCLTVGCRPNSCSQKSQKSRWHTQKSPPQAVNDLSFSNTCRILTSDMFQLYFERVTQCMGRQIHQVQWLSSASAKA